MRKLLLLLLLILPVSGSAQAIKTHQYAVEMAGARVGTITAVREQHADNRSTYTLISDVKLKLLFYTIKVYYKAVSQYTGEKLMLSTVATQTNQGHYTSRTEWKDDHYVISVSQHKSNRQSVERNNIDFSVSSLYFYEPIDRNKVYGEYVGDYFTLRKTDTGTYRALLADHEDEYVYEKGRLVKVVKYNKMKNYVVRRLD